MQKDRFLDLWRNPHPAPRTVLLKVNLIQGPEVHVRFGGQLSEFFYAPLVEADWRLLDICLHVLSLPLRQASRMKLPFKTIVKSCSPENYIQADETPVIRKSSIGERLPGAGTT